MYRSISNFFRQAFVSWPQAMDLLQWIYYLILSIMEIQVFTTKGQTR